MSESKPKTKRSPKTPKVVKAPKTEVTLTREERISKAKKHLEDTREEWAERKAAADACEVNEANFSGTILVGPPAWAQVGKSDPVEIAPVETSDTVEIAPVETSDTVEAAPVEVAPLQTALDERLELALQASNYRMALNTQIDMSKLRLKQDLTISTNGGTFNIDPVLISFVSALIQAGNSKGIILDTNENPILIDNLQEFLTLILDTYYESHNTYRLERDRLRKSRSVASVVGV